MHCNLEYLAAIVTEATVHPLSATQSLMTQHQMRSCCTLGKASALVPALRQNVLRTCLCVFKLQPFQGLVLARGIFHRAMEAHSDPVVGERPVLHGPTGPQLSAPDQQMHLHF